MIDNWMRNRNGVFIGLFYLYSGGGGFSFKMPMNSWREPKDLAYHWRPLKLIRRFITWRDRRTDPRWRAGRWKTRRHAQPKEPP